MVDIYNCPKLAIIGMMATIPIVTLGSTSVIIYSGSLVTEKKNKRLDFLIPEAFGEAGGRRMHMPARTRSRRVDGHWVVPTKALPRPER